MLEEWVRENRLTKFSLGTHGEGVSYEIPSPKAFIQWIVSMRIFINYTVLYVLCLWRARASALSIPVHSVHLSTEFGSMWYSCAVIQLDGIHCLISTSSVFVAISLDQEKPTLYLLYISGSCNSNALCFLNVWRLKVNDCEPFQLPCVLPCAKYVSLTPHPDWITCITIMAKSF